MWIYIETTKRHLIAKMFQQIHKSVMPVWKRAFSAMNGKLRAIHGVWFSAIPAEMTRSAREKELELNYLYNHESAYKLMSQLQCKIALEENLNLAIDIIVKQSGKDKPINILAKVQR